VERALTAKPAPKVTVFKAAIVLGACTKMDRALELLEELESAYPQDGAVLEKKAWVLWLLHRYEDAAQVARSVLEIMPDSEICLRRLIDYETLVGNVHRAEHYQQRLTRLKQLKV